MKRIQDFKIGEEVRIREDLGIGNQYSGFFFNSPMSEYKGRIFSVEAKEGNWLLLKDAGGWSFIPEFFAEDPVIGVKFPGNNKEYSYKCQFPVELGDIIVVTVIGTEKEVTVTSLHGDESKAMKYVTRKKVELTSFSREQMKSRIDRGDTESTEGRECIIPLGVLPGTNVPVGMTIPHYEVQLSVSGRHPIYVKQSSIDVSMLDEIELETAKISHSVEIEVEQEEGVTSKDCSLSLRGITFNCSVQETERDVINEWLDRQCRKLNGVF